MLGNLFGGGESPRKSTVDMNGGKRRSSSRRSSRRNRATRRSRGGSSMLSAAAVPLTLLGLQKFFHGRSGRADLKKAAKNVRKTMRRGRRSLRRVL